MRLRVKSSRLINRYLGGNPKQMLCTRLYVSHTVWAITLIDTLWFWEYNHCYNSFCYDVAHGGFDDD